MQLKLKLSQKGLLLVSFLLAFELMFITTLSFLLQQAEYEIWRESHAKAVIAKADSLLSLFLSAGSTLMAYATTKNAMYGERFDSIIAELPEESQSLQLMCMDNSNAKKNLVPLREQSDRAILVLKQYKSRLAGSDRSIQFFRSRDLQDELEANYKQIVLGLQELTRDQKQLASEPPAKEARYRLLIKYCLFIGIGVNVFMALLLGISFTKEITGRLSIMTDNTHRLSKGEPLNEPMPGSDEIVHLDHTFHEMAVALKQMERLKQEFFAMVTHDLRSPLSSIYGVQMLLIQGVYGELPAKALTAIVRVERNVKRLISLINDLLDIEKIEAGKWELTFDTYSVADIIERSIDSVQALAQQKEISFETKPGGIEIYADGNRLIQVLINLISNAIKYSPDKGIIWVSVERPAGWIEFRVTDQGRGIPKEDLGKVFDRFQQVEASDATVKGGTGLGLAVCKGIIDEHKGTIGVDSELGKGATFWFRIPALQGVMAVK